MLKTPVLPSIFHREITLTSFITLYHSNSRYLVLNRRKGFSILPPSLLYDPVYLLPNQSKLLDHRYLIDVSLVSILTLTGVLEIVGDSSVEKEWNSSADVTDQRL